MTDLNELQPFDPADYLDTEEAIAAYLNEFKDDPEDVKSLAAATVARARARMQQ